MDQMLLQENTYQLKLSQDNLEDFETFQSIKSSALDALQ